MTTDSAPSDDPANPDATPDATWDKSDRLLGGGLIAVRSVPVPVDDQTLAAVAVTLRVPAGQYQVEEADATLTATVLLGPGEALGIGLWLREAAQAADKIGPPIFDWSAGV
jgi:hypothetical protein